MTPISYCRHVRPSGRYKEAFKGGEEGGEGVGRGGQGVAHEAEGASEEAEGDGCQGITLNVIQMYTFNYTFILLCTFIIK